MVVLLSKVEWAYLSGTREFTKAQQRCIRYRLRKKINRDRRDAASVFRDGRVVWDSLVRIPPPPNSAAVDDEREGEKEEEKVGRTRVEPTTPAMSRRYLL
jgi:hypothetical protein